MSTEPIQRPVQEVVQLGLNNATVYLVQEVDRHRKLLKMSDSDEPCTMIDLIFQEDFKIYKLGFMVGDKLMFLDFNAEAKTYVFRYQDVEYGSVFHQSAIRMNDIMDLLHLIRYAKDLATISSPYF